MPKIASAFAASLVLMAAFFGGANAQQVGAGCTPIGRGAGFTGFFSDCATATGTGNAIVLTPTFGGIPTTPQLAKFTAYRFQAIATNTGATTLRIGSLSAYATFTNGAIGPTAIVAGQIIAGNLYTASFDPALNSGSGGWRITGVGAPDSRTSITADIDYYVNPNAGTSPCGAGGAETCQPGSDSNSGLSASAPFATASFAMRNICNNLLLNNVQPRIYLAHGTYPTLGTCSYVGSYDPNPGSVTGKEPDRSQFKIPVVYGDPNSRSSVRIVGPTSDIAIVAEAAISTPWMFEHLQVEATGGTCISADWGGVLYWGDIIFADCNVGWAASFPSSRVEMIRGMGADISGPGGQAWSGAFNGGIVLIQGGSGNNITFSGTPTFSVGFVNCQIQAICNMDQGSFSGTVHGPRYYLLNSTATGGDSYPGDAPGVAYWQVGQVAGNANLQVTSQTTVRDLLRIEPLNPSWTSANMIMARTTAAASSGWYFLQCVANNVDQKCFIDGTGHGFFQSLTLGAALPVASGGTGDTGTAWTAYTPTLVCSVGTLTTTSASGRYKTIGKTVLISLDITLTNVGTCATSITATLAPGTTLASATTFNGQEIASTNKVLSGVGSTGQGIMQLSIYDGTLPIVNGYRLVMSGEYERQ